MLTSEISRVVVLYKISYGDYRCLSKDPTNGVLTTGQERELVNTTSVELAVAVSLRLGLALLRRARFAKGLQAVLQANLCHRWIGRSLRTKKPIISTAATAMNAP
jgi:hypothetical protein